MSLYLYLPFGHIFVQKNSKIFHQYMNRECFPEEGLDIERLDPDTKDKEYLLLSGKECNKDVVVDFTWEGKGYKITCIMTVVMKKNYNDIWNVCTPISQRNQGYLARLFEKYWEWAPNVTTRLYVVARNTKLQLMYKEKFGFKVIKQSPSVYTMERKFKKQRSRKKTITTSWRSRSRKR